MNRTLYEAQIMMASTADIDAGLAFLAPSRLRHAIDSSSSFAVIWDSGATVCIRSICVYICVPVQGFIRIKDLPLDHGL